MYLTIFKHHCVPFITESHATAQYNNGSDSINRKQRVKSSPLTLDFHSGEEREVCQHGSIVSALTVGSDKPRLLQYCGFGRMCCVCEINGKTWKTLHNTPPSLSPSQTLGLLWINCLDGGEWRHEGWDGCQEMFPAALSYCVLSHPEVCYISAALITPRDLRRSTKKHHCLSSTELCHMAVFQENAPDKLQLWQHWWGGLMRRDTLNCLKCKCYLHSHQSFKKVFPPVLFSGARCNMSPIWIQFIDILTHENHMQMGSVAPRLSERSWQRVRTLRLTNSKWMAACGLLHSFFLSHTLFFLNKSAMAWI